MSAKEKSDLPEVAEKRANKAASAAAELVERRVGDNDLRTNRSNLKLVAALAPMTATFSFCCFITK